MKMTATITLPTMMSAWVIRCCRSSSRRCAGVSLGLPWVEELVLRVEWLVVRWALCMAFLEGALFLEVPVFLDAAIVMKEPLSIEYGLVKR